MSRLVDYDSLPSASPSNILANSDYHSAAFLLTKEAEKLRSKGQDLRSLVTFRTLPPSPFPHYYGNLLIWGHNGAKSITITLATLGSQLSLIPHCCGFI